MNRVNRCALIVGSLLLVACFVIAPLAHAKEIKVGAAINLTGRLQPGASTMQGTEGLLQVCQRGQRWCQRQHN